MRTCWLCSRAYPAQSRNTAENRYHWISSHAFELRLKAYRSTALPALMSTIASALNSCATLFAVDIVKRYRPATTDLQQVRIGRPLRVQGLPQAATGAGFASAVGLCLFAAHPQDEWWDFEIPVDRYPARSLKRAVKWFRDNW